MENPSFIDSTPFADLPLPPETERAWAAGFFDGEGNCGVYRGAGEKRLNLSVSQTNTSTLKRFYGALGNIGRLHERRHGPLHQHWSRKWELQIRALVEVERAAYLMWPFLSHPKRSQIEAAFRERIAYRATWPAGNAFSGQKLNDAQVEEIRALLAIGGRSQASIGREYGVAQTIISAINTGKRRCAGTRRRSGGQAQGPNNWEAGEPAVPSVTDAAFIDTNSYVGPSGAAATERAWAAGFFDAEGYFGINDGKYLHFVVTQTETSTLERFRAAAEDIGTIYTSEAARPVNWKQKYQLRAGALTDVTHVVNLLWEYLSEPKRRQIAAAYAARDAYRSTWPAGYRTPQQRVSDDQVREIRALLAEGELTQMEIGRRYGVTNYLIYGIKVGRSRKNVLPN